MPRHESNTGLALASSGGAVLTSPEGVAGEGLRCPDQLSHHRAPMAPASSKQRVEPPVAPERAMWARGHGGRQYSRPQGCRVTAQRRISSRPQHPP